MLRERRRRPVHFRVAFTDELRALDERPVPGDGEPDPRAEARPGEGASIAAALAGDWWRANRTDAFLLRHGSPPTARLAVVWRSFSLVERCPDARLAVVDLGRELDREGLLSGPFDERLQLHGGPVDPHEPGPSRLAALITVAGYATQLREGDRRRWRRRAVDGAAGSPSAVHALVEPVRDLLALLA